MTRTLTLLFASALLLGACAQLPKQSNFDIRDKNAFTHWQLDGKVGVVHKGESKSAYIKWIQDGTNYQISLFGIFGLGKVDIIGTETQVIVNAKDQSVTTTSPEEAVYALTGLDLPVSGLTTWIKGIPISGQPLEHYTHDDRGEAQTFHQLGWKLDYTQTFTLHNLILPKKITATRISPHTETRLKLVIKKWEAK